MTGRTASNDGAEDGRPGVKSFAWLAILAGSLALLAVASFDGGGIESDGERIQRLHASFACPECRGQSVAESNAAVAVNIRQFISDEVTAGGTDDQIRDRLVDAYGVTVLLNPPADGVAALVWILPVVLVTVGSVVLGAFFSHAGGSGRRPSDEDRALLAHARARGRGRR